MQRMVLWASSVGKAFTRRTCEPHYVGWRCVAQASGIHNLKACGGSGTLQTEELDQVDVHA